MADPIRDQAWRFICATFPERQIYIRSDGPVQFFTFGPMMQAIMAGITLLFLGWVAFTSVNTIFKDRIIAAKENHYRQMQTSYEGRIADLQLSYDELNGALVAAEDHFKGVADDLEAKHRTLASLIGRKEALQAALGLDGTSEPLPVGRLDVPPAAEDDGDDAGGSVDVTVPDSAAALAPASAAGQGAVPGAPHVLPPKPKAESIGPSLQPHALLRGAVGAVEKIGQLFRGSPNTKIVNHPALREIAALETRLNNLFPVQKALLAEAVKDIDQETDSFQKTIREAGLDPKTMIGRVTKSRGMGGPEIPLDAVDDNSFGADAMGALDDLTDVVTALRSVPLTTPVAGAPFEITSGFGARRDPFTKRLAFHAGLDFSGPWGSDVHVTAPGVVVFAGMKGAYGNTVEVDHGYGIRTRYGHMSKILVEVGNHVEKGSVVGHLGSTGRSTGPHVHYEVWYDDVVRNPRNFIKAGQNVLQN